MGLLPNKLGLFAFSFQVILTGHEGTRRTVHLFSSTAAFLLNYSWMRHPTLGCVQRLLRRSHPERIPNHERYSKPIYPTNA
jgi:hypothetical protein